MTSIPMPGTEKSAVTSPDEIIPSMVSNRMGSEEDGRPASMAASITRGSSFEVKRGVNYLVNFMFI
jgi:hypothetical protein